MQTFSFRLFSRPLRLFLPLTFVLSALWLSACPALAAHWAISYTCAGQDLFTNGSTTTHPWTTPQAADSTGAIGEGAGYIYSTIVSTGNITPVLTWTKDAWDTTLPPAPAQVSALLTILIACNAAHSGTATASDSYNDPFPNSDPSDCYGSYSHLVQFSNSTQATVVPLPPVHLAFSAVAGNGGGTPYTNASATLRIQFVSPILQGYSTHVSPALTGSEPLLSAWDPTNPRYFSGTGCEAKAIAVPLSGYLSHVQLCINDQVVQEYWDNAAPGKPTDSNSGAVVTGTQLAYQTLAVLFDSTHFAVTSSITIKLKITDSNGGYYEVMVAGPVYNKALVLSNNTINAWWNGISFDDLYEKVAQTATGMSMAITANKYYHVSDIQSALPQNTVFLYQHTWC
jgi:hypothetical protein